MIRAPVWELSLEGKDHPGTDLMEAGISVMRSTGATAYAPWYFSALATAYARSGRAEAGQRLAENAIAKRRKLARAGGILHCRGGGAGPYSAKHHACESSFRPSTRGCKTTDGQTLRTKGDRRLEFAFSIGSKYSAIIFRPASLKWVSGPARTIALPHKLGRYRAADVAFVASRGRILWVHGLMRPDRFSPM
jgi:hypothetical protein